MVFVQAEDPGCSYHWHDDSQPSATPVSGVATTSSAVCGQCMHSVLIHTSRQINLYT